VAVADVDAARQELPELERRQINDR